MSRRKTDIIAGLISTLVAVVFILDGSKLSPDANRFPMVLEWFLIICGLFLIARGIFVKKSADTGDEKEVIDWVRAAVIILATIVYVVCVVYIGFYVSSVLYLVLGSWYLNEHGFKVRPLLLSIVFGVLLSATLYVTFTVFLQVSTPSGLLF